MAQIFLGYAGQTLKQAWRDGTEFMLNLPETEGIAKLYEARVSGLWP